MKENKMVEKGKFKVRYLLDSGILYHNSEIRVLNCDGHTIFSGMGWEMDDDILDLDLKHILSVYPTNAEDRGKVWIEVYDKAPNLRPYMCVGFRSERCGGCSCDSEDCWIKRRKSSHGGFEHEQSNGRFGISHVQWSPAVSPEVKEVFDSIVDKESEKS